MKIQTRIVYSIMQNALIVRYALNGMLATIVHYMVLSINLNVIGLISAGTSNFIAALFGIATSYIGSRYYVFNAYDVPFVKQAVKFFSFYAFVAVLHGLVLYAWSDVYKFDYRIGFLISTTLQVLLSFYGNKQMVFNK